MVREKKPLSKSGASSYGTASRTRLGDRGFGVKGGWGTEGLGCRFSDSGLRVKLVRGTGWGFGTGGLDLSFGCRVQGQGFGVQGFAV
jgi:hypothetical protein